MPWLEPTMEGIRWITSSENLFPVQPTRKIAGPVLGVLFETMKPTTPTPSLVVTTKGGIQLEWHERGVDLEVEVNLDGTVQVFVEFLESGDGVEGPLDDESIAAHVSRAIDRLSAT